MATALSKHWHALSAGTPGRRFRDRYYRAKRAKKTHLLGRVLRWIAAAGVLVIAITLTVIPGPAIPFYFLAGALVAADWLWMAKALDWIELKLRALWERAVRIWDRLPTAAHVALIILGGCLSLATTYGMYRLMS
jgi:hypothetical protein